MAESGQRSPAAVTTDAAPDLARLREQRRRHRSRDSRAAQRTRAARAVDRRAQGGDRQRRVRGRPRTPDRRAAGRAQSGPVPERGHRAGLSRDHLRHALARARAARRLLRSRGHLHAPGGAADSSASWPSSRASARSARSSRRSSGAQIDLGRRAGREHHRGRRHADLRCARRARRLDLRARWSCASRSSCSRAAAGSRTCAASCRTRSRSRSAGSGSTASCRAIERIEAASTAAAARLAAEDGSLAAIGSAIAGEVYGLRTIEASIEDRRDNTTRFA